MLASKMVNYVVGKVAISLCGRHRLSAGWQTGLRAGHTAPWSDFGHLPVVDFRFFSYLSCGRLKKYNRFICLSYGQNGSARILTVRMSIGTFERMHFFKHHHLNCIMYLKNCACIVHIFPSASMVDDPLNQLHDVVML
ncbi:hypothetical protein Tco_0813066 [Tanacetum coccineum]